MEMQIKTLELTFNGENKTVQLPFSSIEDNWNSLERLFREQFNVEENDGGRVTNFMARYVDEEGDKVTLSSNEELCERLDAADDKPLHLEFSVSSDQRKGRRGHGRISKEERLHLRNEKQLRKHGKILSKEEKHQLRKERKNARMLQRFGKILSKEERLQMRSEKAEKRRTARQEKAVATTEGSHNACGHRRRLSPEERKEKVAFYKKQRLEEREAASAGLQSADDVTEWPAEAKHLYLDGNNMMFLTAALRGLTLNHQRGKAESLLQKVAEGFIAAHELQQAILIFDNTRTEETKSIGTFGTTFRVCSARPMQPTSDDVLIAWAKEGQAKGESSAMLFVTSDRALRKQLKEAGGLLMKPKQFLRIACSLATENNKAEEGDATLDTWLSTLL